MRFAVVKMKGLVSRTFNSSHNLSTSPTSPPVVTCSNPIQPTFYHYSSSAPYSYNRPTMTNYRHSLQPEQIPSSPKVQGRGAFSNNGMYEHNEDDCMCETTKLASAETLCNEPLSCNRRSVMSQSQNSLRSSSSSGAGRTLKDIFYSIYPSNNQPISDSRLEAKPRNTRSVSFSRPVVTYKQFSDLSAMSICPNRHHFPRNSTSNIESTHMCCNCVWCLSSGVTNCGCFRSDASRVNASHVAVPRLHLPVELKHSYPFASSEHRQAARFPSHGLQTSSREQFNSSTKNNLGQSFVSSMNGLSSMTPAYHGPNCLQHSTANMSMSPAYNCHGQWTSHCTIYDWSEEGLWVASART